MNMQEFSHKTLDLMTVPASTDWVSLNGAFRGIASPNYYGGNLYAFTRNTDNTLGMCTVSPSGTQGTCTVSPSGTQGTWTKLGGTLLSSPSSAASPNGTLGVIALQQGNVIAINYVNPFQGTQTGFSNFAGGTPSGVSWAGTPVLAVNSNNRLEAFSFDTNGNMWHCFQTSAGTSPSWSNWSLLASTFLANTTFQVFLDTNKGALIATAIGTNNLIYQMVQYGGGGRDGWTQPKLVGSLPTVQPQFTVGTAAAYSSSSSCPVFSSYNSQSGISNNPLMYSASSYNGGIWTNLTTADSPISTSAPVMVNNAGIPQLVYQSATNVGVVYLLSQNVGATNFWKPEQEVGNQNGNLTGQMSAVINSGNVAIFQCGQNGSLYYINFTPS